MGVSTRPFGLSAIHHYNLRNQGWPTKFSLSPNEQGDGPTTVADPLQYTKEKIGVYPSNSDILYNAKTSQAKDITPIGSYSPWLLRKFNYGNTPAPKGHYILNAFNRNRQAASGISGTHNPEEDLDDYRAVSVQFYAGRVFYLKPNGQVLFSQILTDIKRADKCYQEADPTAEDINDLVATDGGVINIRDIGEAFKMVAAGDRVYVFADNGVWYISGTSESGFSASNFEIQKLTNAGANSGSSVAVAEDTVFYWGKSGIYAIVANEVTGFPEAVNITESTIQDKYISISPAARKNAKGFYDAENRKVIWAYNDDSDFDAENWRYRYSEILYYDLVLQAFYSHSIQTGRLSEGFPAHIAGMFSKTPQGIQENEEDVTDSGTVVTDGGVDVTTTVYTTRNGESGLKFLAFNEKSTDVFEYTVSEFRSNAFKDWSTVVSGGVNYSSIVETGADILGDPTVEKFGNYFYAFFERTEFTTDSNGDLENQSGCKFRVKWNWSDAEVSGKWSDLQEIYRFNRNIIIEPDSTFPYGQEVIMTKTKLRGNGKSISIRFESEDGKDFKLLGWAIPFSAVPVQ